LSLPIHNKSVIHSGAHPEVISELHSLMLFVMSINSDKGSPENKKCKQGKYNVNTKTSLQHLNLQFYSFF
jgi:hypothetical protein